MFQVFRRPLSGFGRAVVANEFGQRLADAQVQPHGFLEADVNVDRLGRSFL
jgi:hypothetical protein